MPVNVAAVCEELEAAELAGVEFNPLGAHGEITYRTRLETCSYRLRMVATPEAIRERAKALQKKSPGRGRRRYRGRQRGAPGATLEADERPRQVQ